MFCYYNVFFSILKNHVGGGGVVGVLMLFMGLMFSAFGRVSGRSRILFIVLSALWW